jgi:hypothetical protein
MENTLKQKLEIWLIKHEKELLNADYIIAAIETKNTCSIYEAGNRE